MSAVDKLYSLLADARADVTGEDPATLPPRTEPELVTTGAMTTSAICAELGWSRQAFYNARKNLQRDLAAMGGDITIVGERFNPASLERQWRLTGNAGDRISSEDVRFRLRNSLGHGRTIRSVLQVLNVIAASPGIMLTHDADPVREAEQRMRLRGLDIQAERMVEDLERALAEMS